jgi:hypothetical protein
VIRRYAELAYIIADKNVEVLPDRTLMGHSSYPIVLAKGSVVYTAQGGGYSPLPLSRCIGTGFPCVGRRELPDGRRQTENLYATTHRCLLQTETASCGSSAALR